MMPEVYIPLVHQNPALTTGTRLHMRAYILKRLNRSIAMLVSGASELSRTWGKKIVS